MIWYDVSINPSDPRFYSILKPDLWGNKVLSVRVIKNVKLRIFTVGVLVLYSLKCFGSYFFNMSANLKIRTDMLFKAFLDSLLSPKLN